MKTFIVQTIKKELYDTPEHKKRIDKENKHLPKDKHLSYYRGLRNLSRLLFWTILLSIINALSNLTIGSAAKDWSTIICIITTLAAWIALIASLILVSRNMQDMLNYSEDNLRKD